MVLILDRPSCLSPTFLTSLPIPQYDWRCAKCDKEFDLVQSIKGYDGRGTCPTCGNVSRERIIKGVHFIGAAVENAEYNPALGQVVKNSRHRADIAKQKGLVEIGNEPTEKIHKKFEQDRAEKLKKSWDEV